MGWGVFKARLPMLLAVLSLCGCEYERLLLGNARAGMLPVRSDRSMPKLSRLFYIWIDCCEDATTIATISTAQVSREVYLIRFGKIWRSSKLSPKLSGVP